MKILHTHPTVTWFVVALAAGALATSASSAFAGRPTGMSKQEYAALVVRSDAMNKRYHLGVYALNSTGSLARDRALNERYGNGATRMSAAEFRGVYVRSVALNRLYGLGDYGRQTPVAPPQATPSDGFDWTTVAVGAAAAVGAVLVALGMVGRRRGWHPPVAHGH